MASTHILFATGKVGGMVPRNVTIRGESQTVYDISIAVTGYDPKLAKENPESNGNTTTWYKATLFGGAGITSTGKIRYGKGQIVGFVADVIGPKTYFSKKLNKEVAFTDIDNIRVTSEQPNPEWAKGGGVAGAASYEPDYGYAPEKPEVDPDADLESLFGDT